MMLSFVFLIFYLTIFPHVAQAVDVGFGFPGDPLLSSYSSSSNTLSSANIISTDSQSQGMTWCGTYVMNSSALPLQISTFSVNSAEVSSAPGSARLAAAVYAVTNGCVNNTSIQATLIAESTVFETTSFSLSLNVMSYDSSQLSSAYGNRSPILFPGGQYIFCVTNGYYGQYYQSSGSISKSKILSSYPYLNLSSSSSSSSFVPSFTFLSSASAGTGFYTWSSSFSDVQSTTGLTTSTTTSSTTSPAVTWIQLYVSGTSIANPSAYTNPFPTCLRTNACSPSPCSSIGVCSLTATPPYFSCNCNTNVTAYTGSTCSIYVNPCSQNSTCFNGGTCSPGVGNTFTCSCPLYYYGNRCQFWQPSSQWNTSWVVYDGFNYPLLPGQPTPAAAAAFTNKFSVTTVCSGFVASSTFTGIGIGLYLQFPSSSSSVSSAFPIQTVSFAVYGGSDLAPLSSTLLANGSASFIYSSYSALSASNTPLSAVLSTTITLNTGSSYYLCASSSVSLTLLGASTSTTYGTSSVNSPVTNAIRYPISYCTTQQIPANAWPASYATVWGNGCGAQYVAPIFVAGVGPVAPVASAIVGPFDLRPSSPAPASLLTSSANGAPIPFGNGGWTLSLVSSNSKQPSFTNFTLVSSNPVPYIPYRYMPRNPGNSPSFTGDATRASSTYGQGFTADFASRSASFYYSPSQCVNIDTTVIDPPTASTSSTYTITLNAPMSALSASSPNFYFDYSLLATSTTPVTSPSIWYATYDALTTQTTTTTAAAAASFASSVAAPSAKFVTCFGVSCGTPSYTLLAYSSFNTNPNAPIYVTPDLGAVQFSFGFTFARKQVANTRVQATFCFYAPPSNNYIPTSVWVPVTPSLWSTSFAPTLPSYSSYSLTVNSPVPSQFSSTLDPAAPSTVVSTTASVPAFVTAQQQRYGAGLTANFTQRGYLSSSQCVNLVYNMSGHGTIGKQVMTFMTQIPVPVNTKNGTSSFVFDYSLSAHISGYQTKFGLSYLNGAGTQVPLLPYASFSSAYIFSSSLSSAAPITVSYNNNVTDTLNRTFGFVLSLSSVSVAPCLDLCRTVAPPVSTVPSAVTVNVTACFGQGQSNTSPLPPLTPPTPPQSGRVGPISLDPSTWAYSSLSSTKIPPVSPYISSPAPALNTFLTRNPLPGLYNSSSPQSYLSSLQSTYGVGQTLDFVNSTYSYTSPAQCIVLSATISVVVAHNTNSICSRCVVDYAAPFTHLPAMTAQFLTTIPPLSSADTSLVIDWTMQANTGSYQRLIGLQAVYINATTTTKTPLLPYAAYPNTVNGTAIYPINPWFFASSFDANASTIITFPASSASAQFGFQVLLYNNEKTPVVDFNLTVCMTTVPTPQAAPLPSNAITPTSWLSTLPSAWSSVRTSGAAGKFSSSLSVSPLLPPSLASLTANANSAVTSGAVPYTQLTSSYGSGFATNFSARGYLSRAQCVDLTFIINSVKNGLDSTTVNFTTVLATPVFTNGSSASFVFDYSLSVNTETYQRFFGLSYYIGSTSYVLVPYAAPFSAPFSFSSSFENRNTSILVQVPAPVTSANKVGANMPFGFTMHIANYDSSSVVGANLTVCFGNPPGIANAVAAAPGALMTADGEPGTCSFDPDTGLNTFYNPSTFVYDSSTTVDQLQTMIGGSNGIAKILTDLALPLLKALLGQFNSLFHLYIGNATGDNFATPSLPDIYIGPYTDWGVISQLLSTTSKSSIKGLPSALFESATSTVNMNVWPPGAQINQSSLIGQAIFSQFPLSQVCGYALVDNNNNYFVFGLGIYLPDFNFDLCYAQNPCTQTYFLTFTPTSFADFLPPPFDVIVAQMNRWGIGVSGLRQLELNFTYWTGVGSTTFNATQQGHLGQWLQLVPNIPGSPALGNLVQEIFSLEIDMYVVIDLDPNLNGIPPPLNYYITPAGLLDFARAHISYQDMVNLMCSVPTMDFSLVFVGDAQLTIFLSTLTGGLFGDVSLFLGQAQLVFGVNIASSYPNTVTNGLYMSAYPSPNALSAFSTITQVIFDFAHAIGINTDIAGTIHSGTVNLAQLIQPFAIAISDTVNWGLRFEVASYIIQVEIVSEWYIRVTCWHAPALIDDPPVFAFEIVNFIGWIIHWLEGAYKYVNGILTAVDKAVLSAVEKIIPAPFIGFFESRVIGSLAHTGAEVASLITKTNNMRAQVFKQGFQVLSTVAGAIHLPSTVTTLLVGMLNLATISSPQDVLNSVTTFINTAQAAINAANAIKNTITNALSSAWNSFTSLFSVGVHLMMEKEGIYLHGLDDEDHPIRKLHLKATASSSSSSSSNVTYVLLTILPADPTLLADPSSSDYLTDPQMIADALSQQIADPNSLLNQLMQGSNLTAFGSFQLPSVSIAPFCGVQGVYSNGITANSLPLLIGSASQNSVSISYSILSSTTNAIVDTGVISPYQNSSYSNTSLYWSFTPRHALGNDNYILNVNASDTHGNIAPALSAGNFTILYTPPQPPTLSSSATSSSTSTLLAPSSPGAPYFLLSGAGSLVIQGQIQDAVTVTAINIYLNPYALGYSNNGNNNVTAFQVWNKTLVRSVGLLPGNRFRYLAALQPATLYNYSVTTVSVSGVESAYTTSIIVSSCASGCSHCLDTTDSGCTVCTTTTHPSGYPGGFGAGLGANVTDFINASSSSSSSSSVYSNVKSVACCDATCATCVNGEPTSCTSCFTTSVTQSNGMVTIIPVYTFVPSGVMAYGYTLGTCVYNASATLLMVNGSLTSVNPPAPTPQPTSPINNNNNNTATEVSSSSSLSAGAVAGIVIGVVVFVAIVAVVAVVLIKQRQRAKTAADEQAHDQVSSMRVQPRQTAN